MTLVRLRRPPERSGSALVETTAVIIVFLLLLFGVLEYCRFIFLRQLIDNAAREGARYAVVNTTDLNIVNDATAVVNARMAGFSNAVKNWTVQVYWSDSNGNNIGSPTNAQFGQYIAVQIDCDYNPIVPSLLMMNQTMHLTAKAMMYSEAN
jgi:Flp pilus assembly protein TadG